MSDPIEERHRAAMNALAQVLAEQFSGFGFTLLVFDFGDNGRMNYISNAKREDMVAAMREFIAHQTGNLHEAPRGRQ